MTRTKNFIAACAVTLAFPAAASAQCGTLQGSFVVTCEKGVQVYRHQSLSPLPRGLSPAQAQLKAEKIRAKTARAQIAANARAQAANVKLRERELALQDYNARIYDRNTRGRSGFVTLGGGFGYGGINGLGSPFAVRPVGAGFRSRDGRRAGGQGRAQDTALQTTVQTTSQTTRAVPASRLVGSMSVAPKRVKTKTKSKP